MVPLRQLRGRTVRAAAAIGVFLLGQMLSMLYLPSVATGHPDAVFTILSLLAWLAPFVAWFALKHRTLGTRELKGFPLNVLAELSADVLPQWIAVRIPHQNMISMDGDVARGATGRKERRELRADEDILVLFGPAYLRSKAIRPPDGHSASQASQAVDVLIQAIAHELGLFASPVWELESTMSEDISDELGGHLDHLAVVIQRGQFSDVDQVCEALMRAVDTLCLHFELKPGESPTHHAPYG